MIINNGPYTVYILTNTVNNKLYVGTTKRSLKERFNYGRGYMHQKDFYNDICKYGWNAFNAEIFASNLTEQEAFNIEKLLIAELRNQDPDILYNKDSGGKNGKHCNETKKTIRKLNIGRIVTNEAKEKIKTARAKQVFTRETIEKRNNKIRGQKRSEDFCTKLGERKSKAVKCLENNVVYKSATIASKELNVSISGISQVCKGTIPHIKNMHFEYV